MAAGKSEDLGGKLKRGKKKGGILHKNERKKSLKMHLFGLKNFRILS